MKVGSVRNVVRKYLQEVNAKKDVVNGYAVPSGNGGEAVRTIVDFLLREPGATQEEPYTCVVDHYLHRPHADWLMVPTRRPGSNGQVRQSPVDHLWERRKEVNPRTRRQVWKYYLLPSAEVLAGTAQHSIEKFPTAAKHWKKVDDSKAKLQSNLEAEILRVKDALSELQWDDGSYLYFDALSYVRRYDPSEKILSTSEDPDVNLIFQLGEMKSSLKSGVPRVTVTVVPPITYKGIRFDKHAKTTYTYQERIEEIWLNDLSMNIKKPTADVHYVSKLDSEPPDWRPDSSIPEDWYSL